MVTPVLRAMGERALLAEIDNLDAVLALHAALAADVPVGVDDIVPAARTVLVRFDPAVVAARAVADWIRHVARSPIPDVTAAAPLVEVPVRYDGPDLAETAALLGIPPSDLVTCHAAVEWTVAFTGFAPGFAYLTSVDWPFDVPRLAEPRTRVPAGAVGLAGGFSGAYPRATPGGWRLIATTDAPLFVADAEEPVLLPPRARVRFVPERVAARAAARGGDVPGGGASDAPASSAARIPSGRAAVLRAPASSAARISSAGDAVLRIDEPGPLTTVQDAGRPGRAALGISRSGALDRRALGIANRLVGNDPGAAGLEVTLGGFVARAVRDVWIAAVGPLGDVSVDGRAADAVVPLLLPAGAVLTLGPTRAGARWYLAVRGGVDAVPVLGSRSTDVLAGLGPTPLRAGDEVIAGAGARHPVPVVDAFPWSVPPTDIEVRVTPGPRAEWFADDARERLYESPWTVSSGADRVGVRLDGPALARTRAGELASEGMVPGAVQVPPHGRPVVLLADGPVTGGYPVIAVVRDADLDALAQARPGDRVRFRRG